MKFSDWFSEQVEKYYDNGKNFSDKEKFPLPCVYRWIRGSCIPRPLQISLICTIIAKRRFEKQDIQTPIAYDLIYLYICADVMQLLQRKAKVSK